MMLMIYWLRWRSLVIRVFENGCEAGENTRIVRGSQFESGASKSRSLQLGSRCNGGW
jgi:hypothetical protein